MDAFCVFCGWVDIVYNKEGRSPVEEIFAGELVQSFPVLRPSQLPANIPSDFSRQQLVESLASEECCDLANGNAGQELPAEEMEGGFGNGGRVWGYCLGCECVDVVQKGGLSECWD